MARLEDNKLKLILHTEGLKLQDETLALSLTYNKGLKFCSKTEGIKLIDTTKTLYLGNLELPPEGRPAEPLPINTQYHREEMMIFFEDLITELSEYDATTGIIWSDLAIAKLATAIYSAVTVNGRIIFSDGNFQPIRYTEPFPDPLNPTLTIATIVGGGNGLNNAAYSPTLDMLVCSMQAHPAYFGIASVDGGLTWNRINGTSSPPRGPVVWCPAPWNMFVATQYYNLASYGYGNNWYYSYDGSNWTLGGPSPGGYQWLEYLNGRVIAGAGSAAPILYMDLSRIQSEGPGALSFVASNSRSLAWIHHANNGSRIVIGANVTSGFNRQYSDDGVNWFDATTTGRQVIAMAWTGQQFICSETFFGTSQVGWSDDGITWSFESRGASGNLAPTPFGAIGIGTASDGNLYLFAPSSGSTTQMVYSPVRASAANVFSFGVTIGGHGTKSLAYDTTLNRFASVGQDGINNGRVASSTGLLGEYTDRTIATPRWGHVARGAALFVTIIDTTGPSQGWATSIDGVTWTTHGTGIPDRAYTGLCYGNGKFLAVDSLTENFITHTDQGVLNGDPWTDVVSPFGGGSTGCAFVNGRFWVLRNDEIWSSQDCVSWTRVLQNTVGTLRPYKGITYGNGKYLAVHDGADVDIAESADGVTWAMQATSATRARSRITFGNGVFLGADNQVNPPLIRKSTDGITWTAPALFPSLSSLTIAGVYYINGIFVVAARFTSAAQGRLYYSGA